MTMAVNIAPSPSQTTVTSGWLRRRSILLLGGLVAVLVISYSLAWLSAYRLSQGYLHDADASYDRGSYLDALVGYKEYDEAQKRYVDRGGYMEVERIWADRYALPVPADVARSRERIDEIVNDRLTIDDAETFVQANIGRSNPYLALLYLRLGELYEADGRIDDARDIYSSYVDLFPDETALAARAQANLRRLEASS
jgi:tetratricopeptide (TPR) repeat protein